MSILAIEITKYKELSMEEKYNLKCVFFYILGALVTALMYEFGFS